MSDLQRVENGGQLVAPDINALMTIAAQHGAEGAACLEKLVALQERMEDRAAKREAAEALAKFQRDCGPVEHDKPVMNKDGKSVRYSYATLEHVIASIQPHLLAHGLTYRWNMNMQEGRVQATCTITHRGGHQWESQFQATVDKQAFMSDTQKDASADSYAKRRSLLDALGIVTKPKGKDTSDDDGLGGGAAPLSDDQARFITEWLHDSGANVERFMAWAGVTTVEQIPARDYEKCIAALRQKKGK